MKAIQDSLGYLLNSSARMIKRKLDEQLKKYNLTTSQWAVLKLLSVEGSLSQAEIAEKLNADRATGGVVIDKLIKKGLVVKELSMSDRRSYQVKITVNALKIVDEATQKAIDTNQLAFKGISENDMTIFNHCLETILANLGGRKE